MNGSTKIFYEKHNIDTTWPELSDNDLLKICKLVTSNINFDDKHILSHLTGMDRNYPTCKYIVEYFRSIFKCTRANRLEFWLERGYSAEEAKQKTAHQIEIRLGSNCKLYWIKKGYSEEEAKQLVFEEQSRRLKKSYSTRDELYRKEKSIRCIEYWLKRGYSEYDANIQVKSIQSNYGKRAKGKVPPHKQNTNIEYYLNLGYNEEEAKLELSNRQNTFSLAKCISKYGEDVGAFIFEQRQITWQNTLNKKTPEELDEINRKKSNKLSFVNLSELKEKTGIFYIIKISESHIKIGITSKKTVYNRYTTEDLNGCEILLQKSTNLYYSFLYEQCIKNMLSKHKIKKKDQIKNFGYTETFNVEEYTINEIFKIMENEISFFEEEFKNNEEYIYGMDKQKRKNI